jgi:hypothetical protein
MSVNLSPIGNGISFLGNTGLPLSGGKLYTYQAGSSDTACNIHNSRHGRIANANPIILGSDGKLPSELWLTYGYNYKLVLKDSADVLIYSYDNIYGILGTIPSSGSTLPSGMILLWSGSIGSVPAGYYLCDGSNGTPDLRDRFIVGAGNSYAVNATGGSTDAIVVSHTHTATSTVTDPGHFHTYGFPNTSNSYGSNSGGLNPGSSNRNTSTEVTGITVAAHLMLEEETSGRECWRPPYFGIMLYHEAHKSND